MVQDWECSRQRNGACFPMLTRSWTDGVMKQCEIKLCFHHGKQNVQTIFCDYYVHVLNKFKHTAWSIKVSVIKILACRQTSLYMYDNSIGRNWQFMKINWYIDHRSYQPMWVQCEIFKFIWLDMSAEKLNFYAFTKWWSFKHWHVLTVLESQHWRGCLIRMSSPLTCDLLYIACMMERNFPACVRYSNAIFVCIVCALHEQLMAQLHNAAE